MLLLRARQTLGFRVFSSFHVSCSPVSVVLQFLFSLTRVSVEMFCLVQKHFMSLTQVARVSRLRVRTTFGWFASTQHSIYADRHVGILALLLSSASCGSHTHAAFPSV